MIAAVIIFVTTFAVPAVVQLPAVRRLLRRLFPRHIHSEGSLTGYQSLATGAAGGADGSRA
jgi:hypothetical protein